MLEYRVRWANAWTEHFFRRTKPDLKRKKFTTLESVLFLSLSVTLTTSDKHDSPNCVENTMKIIRCDVPLKLEVSHVSSHWWRNKFPPSTKQSADVWTSLPINEESLLIARRFYVWVLLGLRKSIHVNYCTKQMIRFTDRSYQRKPHEVAPLKNTLNQYPSRRNTAVGMCSSAIKVIRNFLPFSSFCFQPSSQFFSVVKPRSGPYRLAARPSENYDPQTDYHALAFLWHVRSTSVTLRQTVLLRNLPKVIYPQLSAEALMH